MMIHAKRDRALSFSLNRHVTCSFLKEDLLASRLALTEPLARMVEALPDTHPHLFSPSPVFISREDVAAIQSLVATVETVAALPRFRDAVLAAAPAIARFEPAAKGVFFGYDFHLSDDGPKLIEINTNAGGAFLNWALLTAQRACCDAAETLMGEPVPHASLPETWWRMVQSEAGRPLAHVAIVDIDPPSQYLYPEFLLAAALFETMGARVSIVDPAQLTWTGNRLLAGGMEVDLVYNRLTDFHLERSPSQALRAAYLSGRVVVTPHPRAYALFADKANLTLLSDPDRLRSLGVGEEEVAVLQRSVPRTRRVTADTAEAFWAGRKSLFFKPRTGFGSRAAYRGDKITSRVWQDILAHDYVAQEIVRPPERAVGGGALASHLKFDLRAYAYAGTVQLLAARLYDGQTTNFRTQGGGFAPVYLTPESLA